MTQSSKRFKHLQQQVETLGAVDLVTAVKTLKQLEDNLPSGVKHCGFDQTVEV